MVYRYAKLQTSDDSTVNKQECIAHDFIQHFEMHVIHNWSAERKLMKIKKNAHLLSGTSSRFKPTAQTVQDDSPYVVCVYLN